MADVAEIVDGDATAIDRHPAIVEGNEVLTGAGEGVGEPQGHAAGCGIGGVVDAP
jgi:hypothetical protein